MERLKSSEAVIVEAVAQASEMDIFEIGGQMMAEARETMVVTSGVGKNMVVTDDTMVVTDEADENTMVMRSEAGNTIVMTSVAGNTMVVTGETDENTMVATGEADENAMVVSGEADDNTMVVTGEADENTMVMTGEAYENTMAVTGEAKKNMVMTDETVVVTGEVDENTMVVTGAGDPIVVTSEAGDTMIVTTEAGDTMVVTGYKSAGTELMEIPMQDTDSITSVMAGQEVDGVFHQERAVNRPQLKALDLTQHAQDTGDVIDRATDQEQTDDNRGNELMKAQDVTAQDLLHQIEQQQTKDADKMLTDVQPQDDATEDEEGYEIIFVCIHGQTFRCKPQAGTPVKATKESAPAVDACACNKSKTPPGDDGEGVQSSDRKLRNRIQKFICDKCGGRFTQQASLDRHMFSHEDENKKKAAEAATDKANQRSKSGTTQRRTRQQQKHSIEAKSHPDTSCPVCGKVFSRLRALKLHKKQHEKETHKGSEDGEKSEKTDDKGGLTKKQFKCKTCEVVLRNRYKLQRHEEEHLAPEQIEYLSCNECSKVFTRQFNLQRHEKTHKKKQSKAAAEFKSMTCKDCSKVFTRPLHLLRHEKLHIKEGKLINCTFCPKTFEDRFSYNLHNKTHTMQNYYRDMQCEVCQRVVKGPITLKRHMRTHTKEKPYPCRIGCNSSFSSTSYRLSHERMHCKSGQSYLCTSCGEIFANKAKLINHETKIHRGGLDEHGNVPHRSQLPCRYCGRIFYASAVRKRHERIHTNEKPYMCQYCPKSFVHDNALQCHERVHTKERPYQCTVCSKAFSQTGHLRTHMRVHTKEKPYQCQFCKQAFSHLGSRKNHERKHKDVLDPGLQATGPFGISNGTQENIQEPVLKDVPNNNPEMIYKNFQESSFEQVSPHQHPKMTCEDIPDPEFQDVPQEIPEGIQDIQQPEMEEDVTHKIVLSHPEHEIQAAVILQLLESGSRMPNFEGLVHIVQS